MAAITNVTNTTSSTNASAPISTPVAPNVATMCNGKPCINSPLDEQDHNDKLGQNRIKDGSAYTTIFSCVGIMLLIMVIDLWVVMDDGTKKREPYYLTKTDTQINEEKARKQHDEDLKSGKIRRVTRKSI